MKKSSYAVMKRDALRYRWLRANGCVWADKAFSHESSYFPVGTMNAACTPGRVGGEYADSFVDEQLRK